MRLVRRTLRSVSRLALRTERRIEGRGWMGWDGIETGSPSNDERESHSLRENTHWQDRRQTRIASMIPVEQHQTAVLWLLRLLLRRGETARTRRKTPSRRRVDSVRITRTSLTPTTPPTSHAAAPHPSYEPER